MPEHTPHGPNTEILPDVKKQIRALPGAIVSVFHKLGGEKWLLEYAQDNPKEFAALLRAVIPKNVDVAVDHDITIVVEKAEAHQLQAEAHDPADPNNYLPPSPPKTLKQLFQTSPDNEQAVTEDSGQDTDENYTPVSLDIEVVSG